MEPKPLNAAAEITNLRLADFTAEASPFASLGYKAGPWTAYVTFDICQSMPAVAGPCQSGNYIGYFADTLAASHGSLVHQQFNLRHMIKAYNGKAAEGVAPAIPRDRIVGCVLATAFPKPPMNGWLSPSNPKGGTGCISACAVIFKLAEGVPALLGQHLASRTRQSVSIECITPMGNIGIYQPSTGIICPIETPPEEFCDAIHFENLDGVPYPGLPNIGKLNGEQLTVIYGMNGKPVSMRGVGLTPNPAERTAKITSLTAEASEGFAIAAERVPEMLAGRKVRFRSRREGVIVAVTCEGAARLGGLKMNGTPEDPVLKIRLPDNAFVLKRLGDFAELVS